MKILNTSKNNFLIEDIKNTYTVVGIDNLINKLNTLGITIDDAELAITDMLNKNHNCIHFGDVYKTYIGTEKVNFK